MKAIWGKARADNRYRRDTLSMIIEKLPQIRSIFLKEFSSALETRYNLLCGSRFYSDDEILFVIQSRISEKEFLDDPEHFMMRVLLGAATTDHYYTYEKTW